MLWCHGGGGEGGGGLGQGEVRDTLLVLTYAKDETATLAASELHNHASDRDRNAWIGILTSTIVSSHICRSIGYGVDGGRGPGTAAQ